MGFISCGYHHTIKLYRWCRKCSQEFKGLWKDTRVNKKKIKKNVNLIPSIKLFWKSWEKLKKLCFNFTLCKTLHYTAVRFPKSPPKICNSNNWSFCGIHIMEIISVKATVEWKHGFRETLKIYIFLNQEWLGTRRVETSQRNLTSCLHRSKVGLTQYDSVSYFKQSYGCSEYWVCIKYTQQAACTPSTHLLTFFFK